MLPTALRSLPISSILHRSGSVAPAALELLCDPLQRLVHPNNVLYCGQTSSVHYTCQIPLIAKDLSGFDQTRVRSETPSATEQLRWSPATSSRCYSDQPAVRSDDVVVYEGPLKKAVRSLKVRARPTCNVSPHQPCVHPLLV